MRRSDRYPCEREPWALSRSSDAEPNIEVLGSPIDATRGFPEFHLRPIAKPNASYARPGFPEDTSSSRHMGAALRRSSRCFCDWILSQPFRGSAVRQEDSGCSRHHGRDAGERIGGLVGPCGSRDGCASCCRRGWPVRSSQVVAARSASLRWPLRRVGRRRRAW